MNVLELFCVLYMMLRSRAESTIVICKVADAAKCVKRVLIQSIATKKQNVLKISAFQLSPHSLTRARAMLRCLCCDSVTHMDTKGR